MRFLGAVTYMVNGKEARASCVWLHCHWDNLVRVYRTISHWYTLYECLLDKTLRTPGLSKGTLFF